jgi:hypothetical protein
MVKYNISLELASSGLSLYVLGFAMGPLICVYLTACTKDDHINRRGLTQGVTVQSNDISTHLANWFSQQARCLSCMAESYLLCSRGLL